MPRSYTTREEITALGRDHAIEAIRDSGCTNAPDGGWDSWLINGWGTAETIARFAESEEDNQDGWSDSMAEKLRWYNEGATEAADKIESAE